jgi:hypothetical protein
MFLLYSVNDISKENVFEQMGYYSYPYMLSPFALMYMTNEELTVRLSVSGIIFFTNALKYTTSKLLAVLR